MNKLLEDGSLANVVQEGDVIDVTVSPPGEVGSFSEEERSRQVSTVWLFVCFIIVCWYCVGHIFLPCIWTKSCTSTAPFLRNSPRYSR